MKILFDFRVYDYHTTGRGMGRYIYNLVNSILKNYPEVEISIIKNNEKEHPIFNYNNDKVKYYYFNKLDSYNFEQKFDFYFLDDILVCDLKIKKLMNFFTDLYPSTILKHSKRIVCIGHDLIPLIFPKNYLYGVSIPNYIFSVESVNIIEHLFLNSENTKNDFIKYLNIENNKLTVIYGGVDEKFYIDKNIYIFNERINNIISVLGMDERKNIKGLIKGFALAYKLGRIPEDSKLYICCAINKGYSDSIKLEIKKLNMPENRIIITGFISDEEMIKLISTSKASFFPSFYEGLGLPILESYALSTPSFASNVSSTKELVLEECSFDPYDENDIANSIVKAFNDEELCKKSVEFGKKLLEEKCNWDIASKKVVEKLKELNQNIVLDKAIFIEYNDYKLFSYDNSHVFTTITNYNDFEEINNSLLAKEYNNDFIPIEYYNKFLDKYEYNKKIFALGNSDILQYAVKEEDKNNSYLLIYKIEIFNILFDYFSNYLIDDFKKLIKNHYPNYYELIKKINNINKIFNLLIENNIYGFKILFNLTNINNVITNQENIKNLILNEIKDFKININLVNNLI